MKLGSRTSFEARICVLMVGTLFLVLLGVGQFAIREQTTSIVRERQESFDAIARALALSTEPLVAEGDRRVADLFSEKLRNQSWDLRYVVISDDKGRAVYARSAGKQAAEGRFLGEQHWRAVRNVLGYTGVDASKLYKVTIPAQIGGGKWGTFTAGFSMARTRALVDETQSRILLSFAIAMMVGIACAIAFAKSVASLLRAIIRGVRAVAAGNLSYRVPQTRIADELTHLAEAFNYMIDALSNTQEHLLMSCNTDLLTGLYNHRHFHEVFEVEFSRTLRHSRRLSLLMIDIDRFGDYNQRFGHAAGDAVLKELAAIVKTTLRETDVCARYAGDVIVAMLPETDSKEAMIAAERLREAVSSHTFEQGQPFTISIGVATAPDSAAESKALLAAADAALRQAKVRGRSSIAQYEADGKGQQSLDPHRLYGMIHAGDVNDLEALAQDIDERHNLPRGHSRAVAELAAEIARRMNLAEDQVKATWLAGLLRDIGQIAVPDEILRKKQPLTDEERAIIASHPRLGQCILEKARRLQPVLPGILHHHERYDGGGYPDGLAGEDIPLMARILAVADSYRSMLISRPHRDEMTISEARDEISRGSGTQFDPAVVEAFLGIPSESVEQKAA